MPLVRIVNQVFEDSDPPRLVARKDRGSWRELQGGDLVVVERAKAAVYERLPALPYVHPVDAALPARQLGRWGPDSFAREKAKVLMR